MQFQEEKEMMCQKCRAGQMAEYSRKINSKDGGGSAIISGRKCSMCGYVELDNDEEVWSTVGL